MTRTIITMLAVTLLIALTCGTAQAAAFSIGWFIAVPGILFIIECVALPLMDPYKDGTQPRYWHELLFGDRFVKPRLTGLQIARRLQAELEVSVPAHIRTHVRVLPGSQLRIKTESEFGTFKMVTDPVGFDHAYHESTHSGWCVCGLPKDHPTHQHRDHHDNLHNQT